MTLRLLYTFVITIAVLLAFFLAVLNYTDIFHNAINFLESTIIRIRAALSFTTPLSRLSF